MLEKKKENVFLNLRNLCSDQQKIALALHFKFIAVNIYGKESVLFIAVSESKQCIKNIVVMFQFN